MALPTHEGDECHLDNPPIGTIAMLPTFLWARIREDRDKALEPEHDGDYRASTRALNEYEAKRDMILDVAQMGIHRGAWALKRLAVVYSDHPDYDDAWRPPTTKQLIQPAKDGGAPAQ